jgi:hypothetical protein
VISSLSQIKGWWKLSMRVYYTLVNLAVGVLFAYALFFVLTVWRFGKMEA